MCDLPAFKYGYYIRPLKCQTKTSQAARLLAISSSPAWVKAGLRRCIRPTILTTDAVL